MIIHTMPILPDYREIPSAMRTCIHGQIKSGALIIDEFMENLADQAESANSKGLGQE